MKKIKLEKELIALILILVFAFAIRAFAAYFFPLDSDEEFYLSNARLMLHGWLPYRDFSGANNSPLFYFMLASFLKIGGVSIFVGRLLSVFSATITAFLIYKIAKKLYGKTVGLLSSFIFAFSPFTVRYGYAVVTEPTSIMFISLAVYFLILGFEKNDYKFFILNGLALACAILVRRSVGFFIIFEPLLILLVYGIYSEYRINFKSGIKNFFSVPIGFILPFLPAIAYFVSQTNSGHIYLYDPRNLHGLEQFRNLDWILITLCEKALYLLIPIFMFLAISLKDFVYRGFRTFYKIFVGILGFSFLIFILSIDGIFLEIDREFFVVFCCILIISITYLKSKNFIKNQKYKFFNPSMLLLLTLFSPIVLILGRIIIDNEFIINFLKISINILFILFLFSFLAWLSKKTSNKSSKNISKKEINLKTEKKIEKIKNLNQNLKINKYHNKKWYIIDFEYLIVVTISIILPIILLYKGIQYNRDINTLKNILIIFLIGLFSFSLLKYFSSKVSNKFYRIITYSISIFIIIYLSILVRNKPDNNFYLVSIIYISLFSLSAFLLNYGIKIHQKIQFANLILIFWFFSIFYFYMNYQFMVVYFSELAPVGCIMGAVIIFSIYTSKNFKIKRQVNIFISLLILSAIISQSIFAHDAYFTVNDFDYNPKVSTIRKVGFYISQNTDSNEEIFAHPIYAFEADRHLIFNITYMISYNELEQHWIGTPENHGYPGIDEIIIYLDSKNVKYVIIDPLFNLNILRSNNTLENFIYSKYELVHEIENVDIFRIIND